MAGYFKILVLFLFLIKVLSKVIKLIKIELNIRIFFFIQVYFHEKFFKFEAF